MVFLVPPSMEELERRLRERLTESDEEIEGRLARARKELKQVSQLPVYYRERYDRSGGGGA